MIAQWCGDVVCKMHINRITSAQLAEQLGVTPEYVSMVLNGHRKPKYAQEKFTAAVNALVEKAKEEDK